MNLRISVKYIAVFLAIVLRAEVCVGQGVSSVELKKLYDDHRCFDMRAAVRSPDTPLFYRAVAACNFRESKACRTGLQQVQREDPTSEDAWEATSLLAQVALAEGHYREAETQVSTLLRLRPSDKDAQNAYAFFGGLAAYGDQKLVVRKPGSVPVTQFDGNIGASLTINGHAVAFVFDTGANVSVISAGQARLLGLTVHDVNAKMNTATGERISFRIASAPTLRLGNVELNNVAFLVVGDDAEPFVEFPEGQRGIVGLPVLLAAQTLRMHDGVFDVAYKPAAYRRDSANICAYGPTLSVLLTLDGKPMNFALDTGATHTDLYRPFARDFSNLIAAGHNETFTQKGIGSTEEFPVVDLPPVHFEVAGHPTTLDPARVFMKPSVSGDSDYFYGNLGMDLLGQGRELSFDFRAMQLTLR
jgi:gag-polyprotein putative aspartyl protease